MTWKPTDFKGNPTKCSRVDRFYGCPPPDFHHQLVLAPGSCEYKLPEK